MVVCVWLLRKPWVALGKIRDVGLAWRSHHLCRVGCLPVAHPHLSLRRETSWLLLELLGSQEGNAGIERHILQTVAAQPASSLEDESRP